MGALTPQLSVHSLNSRQDVAAIALQRWDVQGKITWPVMRYRIRQVFRNTSTDPLEVVYTFPLATEQVLEKFRVQLQDETVVSKVVSREDALNRYEQAVESGDFAAKLDRHRSNVFTLNLGNLAPGEQVVVEMQLIQLLEMQRGRIIVRIPTVVGPRYIPGHPQGINEGLGWSPPTHQVPDADWITPPFQFEPATYTVSAMFEILGSLILKGIESPSHPFRMQMEDNGHYWIYMGDKLQADRDIVLYLEAQLPETAQAWPFSYKDHQLLAMQLPGMKNLQKESTPKDVIFLIDISGSMDGDKLDTTRQAVQLCLRKLTEGDRFRLIAFESDVHVWQKRWARVTDENLEQADEWLEELEALGGTELLPALNQALVASQQTAPDREPVIVLLTDGQVGNEGEILRTIRHTAFSGRMLLFGIDTTVNQALFQAIASEIPSIVEYIFPGEDIRRAVNTTFQELGGEWIQALHVQTGEKTISLTPSTEVFPLPYGKEWQQFLFMTSPRTIDRASKLILELTSGRQLALPLELVEPELDFKQALLKFWGKRILEYPQPSAPIDDLQLALDLQLPSEKTSWIAVYEREEKLTALPRIQVVPVNFPYLWDQFHFDSEMVSEQFHFAKKRVIYDKIRQPFVSKSLLSSFSIADVLAKQKVRGAIEWEKGYRLWDSLVAAAWILSRIYLEGESVTGYEANLRKLLRFLKRSESKFSPDQQALWHFILHTFKSIVRHYLPDVTIVPVHADLAAQLQQTFQQDVESQQDLINLRNECIQLLANVLYS